MGVALLAQHIVNTCQKTKVAWYVLATEGTPNNSNKTEHSVIKVSGRMHSDGFKKG